MMKFTVVIPALKFCCLLLYLGGAVSHVAALAHPFWDGLRLAAVLVLCIHALQVVFCWRLVRRYRGSALRSALLTLLFGMLHWVPMVWRNRSRDTPGLQGTSG